MSVSLRFDPPTLFNLESIEIGESPTVSGALTVVASGTSIGVFPTWICEFTYPSGVADRFYAVRFVTDDDDRTPFSNRMFGKEGSNLGYFIFTSPSEPENVYLIPTTDPDVSGIVRNWLDKNREYTVTILASGTTGTGLFGSGTAFMDEDVEFTFTSQFCPLWSDVTAVRLRTGPLVDGIPDDTINRMICTCSRQALNKFFRGDNRFGCTASDVPEPLMRWVTCCAGLMALNAAIAGGTIGGNTVKHLGQMTIKYDSTSASLDPAEARKSLQDCIVEAENLIGALRRTMVRFAVQSLTNTEVVHPQRDPTFGRMPRKLLQQDGNVGPWHDSHEYRLYLREFFAGPTSSGVITN